MTKWYLFPGMGASSQMYDALRRELCFNVQCVDWPRYRGESTFKQVAERIIEEVPITGNDVVGGSSMGGMVALEVSRMLDTKAVVLMGSALMCDEINRLIAVFLPLASATPFLFMQWLAAKHKHLVSRMFAASDPDFLQSMCQHVPQWPGYSGSTEKVFRIHGQKDHIITCPQVGCEVIAGAGHLLTITHAKACAAFLEKTYRTVTLGMI